MERTTKRPAFVLAVLVVVLVVATFVSQFLASPASAATLPPRSPAPPGVGYSWGVAPADLPACTWPTEFTEVAGGWSGRRLISAWNGGTSPGREVSPSLVTWGEPCYDASQPAGVRRIRVPFSTYSLPVAVSPASLYSESYVMRGPETIAGTSIWPNVMCASAEWSTTQTELRTVGGGGFSMTNQSLIPGGGSKSEGASRSFSVESGTACARVVSVRMVVCVYDKGALGSGGFIQGIRRCESFVWTADGWYTKANPYNRDPLDVQLCRAGAYSADCTQIDPPEEWTWDEACAYAPSYGTGPAEGPDWGTEWWSGGLTWVFRVWFPWYFELQTSTIAHYLECSFVPPGGWDTRGEITDTWNSSAFVNTFAVIEDAGTAFTITESCGVLMQSTDTPLGPMTIDTCSWASWGAPVKLFILWTSWLAFAFWGIGFVVRSFLAAIKAAPMPNPLVTAVAEEDSVNRIGS